MRFLYLGLFQRFVLFQSVNVAQISILRDSRFLSCIFDRLLSEYSVVCRELDAKGERIEVSGVEARARVRGNSWRR